MQPHKKNKNHAKELASIFFLVIFIGGLFLLSRPDKIGAETGSIPPSAPAQSNTDAPPTLIPSSEPAALPTASPAPSASVPPSTPKPAAKPKTRTKPKHPKPDSTPKAYPSRICRIHNSSAGIKKVRAAITYNGKNIPLSKTPLIEYKGVIMAGVQSIFVKNGPHADYEFNGGTKHVRLVRQNKLVTFHMGEHTLYHSGQRMQLPAAPVYAVYSSAKKTDQMVPFLSLCKALGISCKWNEKKNTYILNGKKITFPGKKVQTRYAYSKKTLAKKEYKASKRVSYRKYLRLLTPSRDTTANFKFLRLDSYREVNTGLFRGYYQYLIEDYCRERGFSAQKSSLYNKADVFLKAARQYGLDPVYLVSQTFLESAYGTSELASGNVIKKVALRSFKRSRKGKFRTKKLKKHVKVYNLYGIKAYDADPFTGGTSYAYYHGWTSVDRAIYGAAKYLNSNYIRGRFQQNTIFKMRFTFRSGIWHQYATSPEYAENIGLRNYLMSDCYADGTSFLYDFPKYR